jgi:hypothetical protein
LKRKKTGFEIVKIYGGFGQIPNFLLLKCVYEGRANPNPLTPKEDDRIDKHLKYYIYIYIYIYIYRKKVLNRLVCRCVGKVVMPNEIAGFGGLIYFL